MWNVDKYTVLQTRVTSATTSIAVAMTWRTKKATFIWISTSSQNALICPTVLSLSLLVCAIFHRVCSGHYVSTPHFAHNFFFLLVSPSCNHFDVFISQMVFCKSILAFVLWCGCVEYLDLCLATVISAMMMLLLLLLPKYQSQQRIQKRLNFKHPPFSKSGIFFPENWTFSFRWFIFVNLLTYSLFSWKWWNLFLLCRHFFSPLNAFELCTEYIEIIQMSTFSNGLISLRMQMMSFFVFGPVSRCVCTVHCWQRLFAFVSYLYRICQSFEQSKVVNFIGY